MKILDHISNWWLWRMNLLLVIVLLHYNDIKTGIISAAVALGVWLIGDFILATFDKAGQ